MASLANPPHILLLQEDHLDAISCNVHTKDIEFWKGEALWNLGIPMGRSRRTSARIIILITKDLSRTIFKHGVIEKGRV